MFKFYFLKFSMHNLQAIMKMDKVDDFEEQFYFDQGCLGRMVVVVGEDAIRSFKKKIFYFDNERSLK